MERTSIDTLDQYAIYYTHDGQICKVTHRVLAPYAYAKWLCPIVWKSWEIKQYACGRTKCLGHLSQNAIHYYNYYYDSLPATLSPNNIHAHICAYDVKPMRTINWCYARSSCLLHVSYTNNNNNRKKKVYRVCMEVKI